jgi:hypothetical protein
MAAIGNGRVLDGGVWRCRGLVAREGREGTLSSGATAPIGWHGLRFGGSQGLVWCAEWHQAFADDRFERYARDPAKRL